MTALACPQPTHNDFDSQFPLQVDWMQRDTHRGYGSRVHMKRRMTCLPGIHRSCPSSNVTYRAVASQVGTTSISTERSMRNISVDSSVRGKRLGACLESCPTRASTTTVYIGVDVYELTVVTGRTAHMNVLVYRTSRRRLPHVSLCPDPTLGIQDSGLEFA